MYSGFLHESGDADVSSSLLSYEDGNPDALGAPLSYENDVPYEGQLPTPAEQLSSRIGKTKVYPLEESSVARLVKRKRGAEEEEVVEEDADMDGDPGYRANAILLTGSPISHLPTDGLFAYASHFNATPGSIEWLNDTTCVFVYPSKRAAQRASLELQKVAGAEEDIEGYFSGKAVPVALWPPEERISQSLGKGEGLKGAIRFRWALHDDVKKKGARKESEFYRKHGDPSARDASGELPSKRRRRGPGDDLKTRLDLDDELDAFLADDTSDAGPPSPPSKMRSDYIANDGRTLLERTSLLRAHPDSLADRITAPLRRRRGRGRAEDPLTPQRDEPQSPPEREGRRRSARGGERVRRSKGVDRPRKTQQELDDELDSFLNEKD